MKDLFRILNTLFSREKREVKFLATSHQFLASSPYFSYAFCFFEDGVRARGTRGDRKDDYLGGRLVEGWGLRFRGVRGET